MYRYIQGSAVSQSAPGVYNPVRLDTMTFADIFTQFSAALAEIEVVELKRRYSLNLWNLPTNLRALPITLGNWLVSIGNQTIPLDDDIPKLDRVYATYRDVWQYGFQVQGYNRNISTEQPLTLDQMIDAIVTKDDVTYSDIDKYTLFVVNGLIHNSTSIPEGCIIEDAGRSLRVSKENRIGIINFETIGAIQRVPIKAEYLIPPTADLPYKDSVYIRIPDVDMKDKTVGIVIGGFLHLLDGRYDQVGSNLVKINLRDYPLVERYWALKQNTDVSGFTMTSFENRVDKLDFSELTSDENITALLTLSQSFFVVIDAVGVGVERVMAHQAELAGRYVAYSKPLYPLVSDSGRLINYTSYAAKHDYVVRTSDWKASNLMLDTWESQKGRFATNHRRTLNPIRYQDAYWLQIFTTTD